MKKRLLAGLCAGVMMIQMAPAVLAAEETEKSPEEVQVDHTQVSWETLDDRILGGNLNALALRENIGTIQAIDYEIMQEQLRDTLNDLSDTTLYLSMLNQTSASQSMQATYNTVRETYDALKDGEMQADNETAVWQIENGMTQMVMGGQTLYLSLLSLERAARDGERGLATLDRSLDELRLRQKLGQVSEQTVANVEQTRADTVSQLTTLDANITALKMQLQALMGEEATGELTLAPLPEEDEAAWSAVDYPADLEAAKQASVELYLAAQTLEDAQEDWKDSKKDAKYDYQKEVADRTYEAAKITYDATVRNFETSLLSLYHALEDYEQVVENREQSLRYQERQLSLTQQRYELGRASANAVAAAEDQVAAAQSALESARQDLFSARNTYRMAVEHGIV